MNNTYKDYAMSKDFEGLSKRSDDTNFRLEKLASVTADIVKAVPLLTESVIDLTNKHEDHEYRLRITEESCRENTIITRRLSDKEIERVRISDYLGVKAMSFLLKNYLDRTGEKWDLTRRSVIGTELSKLCKDEGIEKGTVFESAQYPRVGSYPPKIWKKWLKNSAYPVPEELWGSYE